MHDNVALYKIGVEDESYSFIKADYIVNKDPYVYYHPCSDGILALKNKKIDSETVNRIDKIDPESDSPEFKQIICLADEGYKDSEITDFCVYKDRIYAVCRKADSKNSFTHWIRVYDKDGKFIEDIEFNSETNSLINNNGSSKVDHIRVFGRFAQISPRGDVALVIEISSETADIVLEKPTLSWSRSLCEDDNWFLFSSTTGEVWEYDKNSDMLLDIRKSFSDIPGIFVSGDDVLVDIGQSFL